MSMESAITQAIVAHHAHVNQRWAETPVGATLCVHDMFKENSETTGNNMKVVFVVESHIIHPGSEECSVKYRKVQYGPKGPSDD